MRFPKCDDVKKKAARLKKDARRKRGRERRSSGRGDVSSGWEDVFCDARRAMRDIGTTEERGAPVGGIVVGGVADGPANPTANE